MGKRKIFVKTDLTSAQVEHTRDAHWRVTIPDEHLPPTNTLVEFDRNAGRRRSFDFAQWYGVGIDPITYACQRQIERFLGKQDAEVEISTVAGYCVTGLTNFLDYLVMFSAAQNHPLSLADINRNAIDGYLLFLRDKGLATTSQSAQYKCTKSVLMALGRRGIIHLVYSGDEATLPKNPFPGLGDKFKGVSPLPRSQRKAFTLAVKTAVIPLLTEDTEPSSELLSYALLVVALHTGRNTTPLLEMSTECLRAHPRDDTEFLVLYKRRGHSTYKVALRAESSVDRVVESTPVLRPTVVRLIRRVIELTAKLRQEAPEDLQDRVWLFRSQRGRNAGQITALTAETLAVSIRKLIADYQITDPDGTPLLINVSRLRKTFVNRINEILDGDVVATAIAAGNQPKITVRHYLRSGEDAQHNWRFLGTTLVEELLTNTLGATERTPVGRCSDSRTGEYAPKRDGGVCQSFLNCLRCRNYVVTGDDLWRLFSFYWRVLREQPRVDKRRWDRQLSHIPRLIERDVIETGLARGVFKQAQVDAARERARYDSHPFWAAGSIISELEELK